MRTSTRSFLLLGAFYVAVVALLVGWANRELDESTEAVVQATAELLGGQVGAVAGDLYGDELRAGTPAARRALLNQLYGLRDRTELVRGVELVDARGEVFSSDRMEEIGQTRPRPDELFGPDRRSHVLERSPNSGAFVLAVPLESAGSLTGYVRLELVSNQIERLYAASARRLALLATVALVLLGGLGFALHVSLRRTSRGLVTSVSEALGERIESRGTSFEAAAAAIQRLGDRFRSERAVRSEISDRLSLLERTLDAGVCLVDSDGRVALATRRAQDLLGLGRGASDADWREALAPLRPVVAELMEEGRGATRQLAITPGAGGRAVRCRLAVVDEGGAVFVQLGDEGALEVVETDLQQAAQLRSLAHVYLGVAHDLRAPLNAMVLHLELWKRFLRDAPLDEEVRAKQTERLEIVESEIERLRRTLEILLSQAAPARSERETFELGGVVREIGALLGPQARQQGVEVVSEIGDPAPVHGLRDQVKQAIVNIAVNALEVMPEGGRLTLRTKRTDGLVRLDVVDTGPGISPDHLDRIFELRFTSKSGGTGIGLYVSRSMLEAQGGTIESVSSSDEGTTFTITLPTVPDAG